MDRGRDGKSNRTFPLTPAVSPRERENHSAPQEGRVRQGVRSCRCWSGCRGAELRLRGIEANIPRMLTKRSHVLPLPEGEGGVRGKELPCCLRLSFQPLARGSVPPKKSKEPFDQTQLSTIKRH
jgi:hypothetical protein